MCPVNARAGLTKFIKKAKKELLMYEMKISDKQMIALLNERAKAGVDVRVIGRMTKKSDDIKIDRMPGMRLHLRAMLRDGQDVFVGSQSLRALELDKRREVGIIVRDRKVAKRFREVFEEDWLNTAAGKGMRKAAEKQEKTEKAEKEEVAAAS